MFRDLDGAITFHSRLNPWHEQRMLDETFPEPLSAAEEMLGELACDDYSRNFRDGAGPTYSQLFFGEDTYETDED